jgi:RNA 2',3'-cyclic 3'-phosphodiesterase
MAPEADFIRAFISMPPDPAVLGQLCQFQKTLEQTLPPGAVRWTSPAQLHLTLKFLGNIASQAVAEIRDALAQIGSRCARMELRAEGLGGFPSLREPRVIWVGLQGDLAALERLNSRIEHAMRPWAAKDEYKAFNPHLTLGRVRENAGRQARAMGAVLGQIQLPSFGQWRAGEFCLMRSQLSPQGAVYSELAKFPFNKSPVAGGSES